MDNVVMEDCHLGQYTTKPSQNVVAVEALSIGDLPQEIMGIIFGELDSISRKRIERVCKRWMQIIRTCKKFRTHLQVTLPPDSVRRVRGYHEYSYLQNLFRRLHHLVGPELEVLHFKSPEAAWNFESDQLNCQMTGIGIRCIMLSLKSAGIDPSEFDIVFSGCSLEHEIRRGDCISVRPRKMRIIRSLISASEWFGCSTLYFEEVWLETLDQLHKQIGELFLSEHGPLTAGQSDVLREIEHRVTTTAEPVIERINRMADRINRIQVPTWLYVGHYNWIDALATIANGGHVSKHTADFLGKSMHVLNIDAPLDYRLIWQTGKW